MLFIGELFSIKSLVIVLNALFNFRDIKGKNIMLMQNGVIKLIDFGCAKRLKKNQSENSMKNLLKSLKGTPVSTYCLHLPIFENFF